jgi:hypothetical protein
MKSKVADRPRRKEDVLAQRYGRIGMRVVAAAAPYQPKPEDHPSLRGKTRRADKGKSKRSITENR